MHGLVCMAVSAMLVLLPASQAQVDIRVPPTIIKQTPRDKLVQVLQEDEETVLDCVADGYPAPEYEWKFKGEPLDLNDANIIPEGDGMSIRVILAPLQVGSYQCFAWNQYGKTMTDTTHLLRAVLANFPPNVPNVDMVVDEGDPLVVTCSSTKSVPEPTYRWDTVVDRDDNNAATVSLNRRIQQDEKGNLYFSHTKRGDEADSRLYKCVATNPNFGGAKFGSYTTITVNPSSGGNKAPSNMYYTGKDSGSDVIAIRGKTLRLQCLFSGKPEPQVSWTRPGGTLPSARVRYESFSTVMLIDDVVDADEATYRCTASGSGSSFQDIKVVVQSAPVYLKAEDGPSNMNVTQGNDAVFRCDTDADPPAQVEWFMNGEVITGANKPERVVFEEENKVLRVVDVCKDCPGPELTDLKVYQCNASNAHGYQFTAGYLNILIPTTIVTAPIDIELEYGEEVRFVCEGMSDDSTPIKYTWLMNNRPISYKPDEIELVNEKGVSTLLITTKDLTESGREYCANYTCIVTNGYTTVNTTAALKQPPVPPPPPGATTGSMGDLWWVFLIIGILLLILLLLLICCLCCQRNRGDAYPVDEKERANGNDPEKELADSGFHDYQRPEDEPIKGSRASLGSAMKLDDSDDDASLADYGDIDTGKFNEDGSFIGQYNTADRRRAGDSQV